MRPEFEIGQKVYHITPDSECGVITDWQYTKSTDKISYCVSIGFEKEIWCYSHELTEQKLFS